MDAVAETRPVEKALTTNQRILRFLNKTPIHIALGVIALIWLAPTIGLLVTSFRPQERHPGDRLVGELPQFRYTLENYQEVLTSQGMLEAFVNTMLIAVPSTLIPLVLASMAAYAFSWLNFPFRDGLFLLVVALLMIPVQVAFIPLLKLFAPTGLLNGYRRDLAGAHGIRAAIRDLPAAQLLHHAPT